MQCPHRGGNRHAAAPEIMSEIRLEYLPLRELQRFPRNPKRHDEESIQASIRRWGYIQPIVIDERTGRIVAGHGRLDALSAMRDAGQEPPERIRAAEGDWLAPVLRGVQFDSHREAEAFLLADNQTTIAGGYDEPALAAMLRDLRDEQVPIIGWSDEERAKLTGAAMDLSPPEVGGEQGAGLPMRHFSFDVPEDDAVVVDRAFAALRGGHRDVSDGQVFVAICRRVAG